MLRCVSSYLASFRFEPIGYQPGDEINDAEIEAHVMSDSPGSFVRIDGPGGAVIGGEPAEEPAPDAPADPEEPGDGDPGPAMVAAPDAPPTHRAVGRPRKVVP